MTLLEFARDQQQVIDILQDDKALFVLTFINELGNTNRAALISHLGWDGNEIDRLLKLLEEADLTRNVTGFDPVNPIRLAADGVAMIAALHFPRRSNELLERALSAKESPLQLLITGKSSTGKTSLINSLFRPERVIESPGDLDLFNRARDGDSAAAEAFFQKYASVAFREAFSVLRHEEDAEDAAQRTFINLLTTPYKPVDRPIKPFVRSVAHHAAVDLRKRQSRRHEESIDKYDPPQTDIASAWFRDEHARPIRELFTRMLADVDLGVARSPNMLVEQRELAESLALAFRKLTSSERAIFGLLLEGMPTSQIAELLHMTPAAVHLRRHRMVEKLRRYLQESQALPSQERKDK